MATYYDFSSGQNLLSLNQKFNFNKQCNNICTTVLFDKKLDFNVLTQAIEIAYERNDALRVRITKVGKKDQQYFADSGLQEIELLDFNGQTQEAMDMALKKLARKRITYKDKPLSRIYLLISFDGKTGVYFINSHMILDSWGVNVFYKDLFEVYEALVRESDLPKPIASYEKLLQKELAYPNSPKYKSDYEFWKSEVEQTEPIYTDITGPGILEEYRRKKRDPSIRYFANFNLNHKSDNKMLWFPKDIVEKAEKYCMDNGFSVQHLFFLANRNYLAKVNNREKDIFYVTSVARRATLEEKNSGGTRVHCLPIRTIMEENVTCREALEIIREKQSILYKHADYDYVDIDQMLAKHFKTRLAGSYDGIMFTFQPLRTVDSLESGIHTNWYDNGGYPGVIYLTVMDGDGTGAYKCYYQYRLKRITEDTIKNWHSYLEHAILAGIENDKITIGELLDIK